LTVLPLYLPDFFGVTHFRTFPGENGKNFSTLALPALSNSSDYLKLFMKIMLASELLLSVSRFGRQKSWGIDLPR
jgi:hypothetical protein